MRQHQHRMPGRPKKTTSPTFPKANGFAAGTPPPEPDRRAALEDLLRHVVIAHRNPAGGRGDIRRRARFETSASASLSRMIARSISSARHPRESLIIGRLKYRIVPEQQTTPRRGQLVTVRHEATRGRRCTAGDNTNDYQDAYMHQVNRSRLEQTPESHHLPRSHQGSDLDRHHHRHALDPPQCPRSSRRCRRLPASERRS